SLVRSFDQEKNNIQAQQKKKMVKSSSSSENEPCCSKACKKNTDSLNSKITDLSEKLGDKENIVLKFKVESRANCIESLTKELELIKKEKEGLDSKLAGFQTASKDLDSLLESQRLDKNKKGLGYSVVPPTPAQVYSPPKKDISSGFENGESTDSILSKPEIKFVKAVDRPAERPTTNKFKTAKKSTVKYVELYRKPSKKSTVRGNQRNWNNLKSQQLGEKFVMKKACYNCGGVDHLSYNYGK
nr:hypothetical protein [Tanacetum cinerariifolium]